MATYKKKLTWEMLKYYDTRIKEVIAKKLSLTGGIITDGTKEMNITPDGITGDDSQVLSKFNKLQASQFEGNIVTLLPKNSTIPFYLENIETNLNEDGIVTYKNEFRLYDDNGIILKYVAHGDTLETPLIVKAGGLNITHNLSTSSYSAIKNIIKTSASGFVISVDSTSAKDGTKYSNYIKTSNSKLSIKGADLAIDSDKNITIKTNKKMIIKALDFEYSVIDGYNINYYPYVRMTSSMIQAQLESSIIKVGNSTINIETDDLFYNVSKKVSTNLSSDYSVFTSETNENAVCKIRLGSAYKASDSEYIGTALTLGKNQIKLGHSTFTDNNFSGFADNIKSSLSIDTSSITLQADDIKFNDNNKTQMFRIKNNAITLREKISLKYNEDNDSLDFVFAS